MSIALVWLMAAALVGAAAFGSFTGRGIVAVALLAFVGPLLILRGSAPPKST